MVTQMPNLEDNTLYFKNLKKQMSVSFVVYADFKCILESMNVKSVQNTFLMLIGIMLNVHLILIRIYLVYIAERMQQNFFFKI